MSCASSTEGIARLASTAGNGAEDQEGLAAFRNSSRKRHVRRLKREVFFASEEAQEGSALAGVMVADGSGKHGIASFEGVENRGDCEGGRDGKPDVAIYPGQGAQMIGELNADFWLSGVHLAFSRQSDRYSRVWTSTLRTAGRSWTIADQESPASAEQ